LTLFTTHFAALADLERSTDGAVVNHHVDAREAEDSLTLLYRLRLGPSTKSFGLHCARLAKFPEAVLADARRLAYRYDAPAYADAPSGPREIAT